MAKRKYVNWQKVGREITPKAAMVCEGGKVAHLGTDEMFASVPLDYLDGTEPVEIENGSFAGNEVFSNDVTDTNCVDLKGVFRWLPAASATLPDWMHSVYIQKGRIFATDNEILVGYDFSAYTSDIGFLIPPKVIGVLKKATCAINGVRCELVDRADKIVTFRFTDGSYFTYRLPPTDDWHVFDMPVCNKVSVIGKEVCDGVLDVLKEVPYAVAISPVSCSLVELQRELLDERVLYQNDWFDGQAGAYKAKSFKKVFKALRIGTDSLFETDADSSRTARFSFVGKDGCRVDGILGALHA